MCGSYNSERCTVQFNVHIHVVGFHLCVVPVGDTYLVWPQTEWLYYAMYVEVQCVSAMGLVVVVGTALCSHCTAVTFHCAEMKLEAT